MAVLLRDALGATLRDRRNQHGRTLRAVAYKAPCSLGYASEVERGEKEVSSELLNSLINVHGMELSAFLREVADKVEEMEENSASRSNQDARVLAMQ